METIVWTTPKTNAIELADAEEAAFNKKYLDEIGLVTEEMATQIIGGKWTALLAAMNASGENAEMPDVTAEMQKLKGYPIIIDGAFFSSKEGGVQEEAQVEGGVRGRLGGLMRRGAKKVLTKKEDPAIPKLSFRTEIIEISNAAVAAAELSVPSNYKAQ